MTMQITTNQRRQHPTFEEAERAIECFYPAGYTYEIVPVRLHPTVPQTYAVKVWPADGCGPWLGFAFDPDEEREEFTMARKTSAKTKLVMPKVAKKRLTYAERSGQTSRAANRLAAAVNGRAEQHWTHETIRSALLRRQAIEIDELLEELPRPAISYAVTKGWLHRAQGEPWMRVTTLAASQLGLPCRHNGRKLVFVNAAKLPPSLPAFDEPKPQAKPQTPAEREAEILTALREPRDVLAQARLYRDVMIETGWTSGGLARKLETEKTAINRRWGDVILHIDLLALEPEYQQAVAGGRLSLLQAYELYRVPSEVRPQMVEAFKTGLPRLKVRRLFAAVAQRATFVQPTA